MNLSKAQKTWLGVVGGVVAVGGIATGVVLSVTKKDTSKKDDGGEVDVNTKDVKGFSCNPVTRQCEAVTQNPQFTSQVECTCYVPNGPPCTACVFSSSGPGKYATRAECEQREACNPTVNCAPGQECSVVLLPEAVNPNRTPLPPNTSSSLDWAMSPVSAPPGSQSMLPSISIAVTDVQPPGAVVDVIITMYGSNNPSNGIYSTTIPNVTAGAQLQWSAPPFTPVSGESYWFDVAYWNRSDSTPVIVQATVENVTFNFTPDRYGYECAPDGSGPQIVKNGRYQYPQFCNCWTCTGLTDETAGTCSYKADGTGEFNSSSECKTSTCEVPPFLGLRSPAVTFPLDFGTTAPTDQRVTIASNGMVVKHNIAYVSIPPGLTVSVASDNFNLVCTLSIVNSTTGERYPLLTNAAFVTGVSTTPLPVVSMIRVKNEDVLRYELSYGLVGARGHVFGAIALPTFDFVVRKVPCVSGDLTGECGWQLGCDDASQSCVVLPTGSGACTCWACVGTSCTYIGADGTHEKNACGPCVMPPPPVLTLDSTVKSNTADFPVLLWNASLPPLCTMGGAAWVTLTADSSLYGHSGTFKIESVMVQYQPADGSASVGLAFIPQTYEYTFALGKPQTYTAPVWFYFNTPATTRGVYNIFLATRYITNCDIEPRDCESVKLTLSRSYVDLKAGQNLKWACDDATQKAVLTAAGATTNYLEAKCFSCVQGSCTYTGPSSGTHPDAQTCAADSSVACGWKYGCDPVAGACTKMQSGQWSTPDECKCFDCNYTPDNDTWECTFQPGGRFPTKERCGAEGKCGWPYTCNDATKSCELTRPDMAGSTSWKTREECKCWSCDSGSGVCMYTPGEASARYADEAACVTECVAPPQSAFSVTLPAASQSFVYSTLSQLVGIVSRSIVMPASGTIRLRTTPLTLTSSTDTSLWVSGGTVADGKDESTWIYASSFLPAFATQGNPSSGYLTLAQTSRVFQKGDTLTVAILIQSRTQGDVEGSITVSDMVFDIEPADRWGCDENGNVVAMPGTGECTSASNCNCWTCASATTCEPLPANVAQEVVAADGLQTQFASKAECEAPGACHYKWKYECNAAAQACVKSPTGTQELNECKCWDCVNGACSYVGDGGKYEDKLECDTTDQACMDKMSVVVPSLKNKEVTLLPNSITEFVVASTILLPNVDKQYDVATLNEFQFSLLDTYELGESYLDGPLVVVTNKSTAKTAQAQGTRPGQTSPFFISPSIVISASPGDELSVEFVFNNTSTYTIYNAVSTPPFFVKLGQQYGCVDGTCTVNADGPYATLTECLSAGCEWKYGCDPVTQAVQKMSTGTYVDATAPSCWGCVNGTCAFMETGGTHKSKEECSVDPVAKCGWMYGCDVASKTCTKKLDGTSEAGGCKCWDCVDGACTFAGDGGKYGTEAECNTDPDAKCGWKYGCDPASKACVQKLDGTVPTSDACTCYSCVNDACVYVGDAGTFKSEAECKADPFARCGWKYGCMPDGACGQLPNGTREQGQCTCFGCANGVCQVVGDEGKYATLAACASDTNSGCSGTTAVLQSQTVPGSLDRSSGMGSVDVLYTMPNIGKAYNSVYFHTQTAQLTYHRYADYPNANVSATSVKAVNMRTGAVETLGETAPSSNITSVFVGPFRIPAIAGDRITVTISMSGEGGMLLDAAFSPWTVHFGSWTCVADKCTWVGDGFGSFDTQQQCLDEGCEWKYACNASTKTCAKSPTGTTEAGQCKCWDCVNGACSFVGDNGEYGSEAECKTDPAAKCGWKYGCDATTQACVQKIDGTREAGQCTCFSCVDGACSYVGDDGAYGSEAACKADPVAQCGWKYGCDVATKTCIKTQTGTKEAGQCTCWGCSNGSCAYVGDSGTYPTQLDCQVDPVAQCGWKYGCDIPTKSCIKKVDGIYEEGQCKCYDCVTVPGQGDMCAFSYDGSPYATQAECEGDAQRKCGWKLGCDATSQSCTLTKNGSGVCNCWTCNRASMTGSPCTFTTTGGEYTSLTQCQPDCIVTYGCDGMGNVIAMPQGTMGACGTDPTNCKCSTCVVDREQGGIYCTPANYNASQTTTANLYSSLTDCSADVRGQCYSPVYIFVPSTSKTTSLTYNPAINGATAVVTLHSFVMTPARRSLLLSRNASVSVNCSQPISSFVSVEGTLDLYCAASNQSIILVQSLSYSGRGTNVSATFPFTPYPLIVTPTNNATYQLRATIKTNDTTNVRVTITGFSLTLIGGL